MSSGAREVSALGFRSIVLAEAVANWSLHTPPRVLNLKPMENMELTKLNTPTVNPRRTIG